MFLSDTRTLKPTSEQEAALAQALTGTSFKVIAYAGAGKTTTLKLISDAKRDAAQHAGHGRTPRGLYLAFNKAIATEAQGNFPSHVDCRTFHSLAFRHVHRGITQKLSLPRLSPARLAKDLGLQPVTLRKKIDGRYEFARLTAANQASMVNAGLAQFCQTHASYPAPRHLQLPNWLHPDDASQLQEQLYPYLETRWQQSCDPNHQAGIGHEIYLKLWALGKPIIPADFVLFDEAQDADPLMLGILLKQTQTQVIYVGDAHQQIYEWRGATNAMKGLPLPDTRLTKSFRFGDAIASVANTILHELGEDVPLQGNAAQDSTVQLTKDCVFRNAILCRTNASAILRLIAGLRQGHKISLQADHTRLIRFADAAEKLKVGKTVNNVPELAYFHNWKEVMEFVESTDGSDIKSMVKLVDEYGSKQLKNALNALSDPKDADYVISTAHKAKGLEWQNVQLDNDFNYDIDNGQLNISPEELRLLYVACTRAKSTLNTHGINDLIARLQKNHARDKLTSHAMQKVKDAQSENTTGDYL